jgi:hypothetical protein
LAVVLEEVEATLSLKQQYLEDLVVEPAVSIITRFLELQEHLAKEIAEEILPDHLKVQVVVEAEQEVLAEMEVAIQLREMVGQEHLHLIQVQQ